MLLNKIPVLDDGYVALISSATSHQVYNDVLDEFFESKDHASLQSVCYATLVFKAPIFVQLHLSQHHGLSLISTRKNEISAYKPNPGEIGSPDFETSRLIANDIAATTEALLINPAAYVADGADRFISQLIMPVSTYATFIVGGSLDRWQKFYNLKNTPAPIKAYALAVEQIIKAEWKNV